jgi:hypothetical protein
MPIEDDILAKQANPVCVGDRGRGCSGRAIPTRPPLPVVGDVQDATRHLKNILSSFDLSELPEIVELKKQIQVAHNVLRVDFGRSCYPPDPTRKCAICEEIERAMGAVPA